MHVNIEVFVCTFFFVCREIFKFSGLLCVYFLLYVYCRLYILFLLFVCFLFVFVFVFFCWLNCVSCFVLLIFLCIDFAHYVRNSMLKDYFKQVKYNVFFYCTSYLCIYCINAYLNMKMKNNMLYCYLSE